MMHPFNAESLESEMMNVVCFINVIGEHEETRKRRAEVCVCLLGNSNYIGKREDVGVWSGLMSLVPCIEISKKGASRRSSWR